ncbi:MAG: hypothetical protein LC792_25480, partial [Actinobacteria bacterium]|nr:hypothetical protein [Actinomycetota bacterium]
DLYTDGSAGGPSWEQAYGEGGNDYIQAGNSSCFCNGGIGNDEIQGGPNRDAIQGGPGRDRLFGNDGNDDVAGGDVLAQQVITNGASGTTTGDGADELYGGPGPDYMYGDLGNDTIDAAEDTDTDNVHGGPGVADRCLLTGGTDQAYGGCELS